MQLKDREAMTPEEKIGKLSAEAIDYCNRVQTTKDPEVRQLWLNAAIVKLFGALNAIQDLRDPNPPRWNEELWKKQQEELRKYLVTHPI